MINMTAKYNYKVFRQVLDYLFLTALDLISRENEDLNEQILNIAKTYDILCLYWFSEVDAFEKQLNSLVTAANKRR